MARRRPSRAWEKLVHRSFSSMSRLVMQQGSRLAVQALKSAAVAPRLAAGTGDWLPGVAIGAGGMRRFRLYRPPDLQLGERLPLMVMLHGCGQNADTFAASTRMNRLAARERFLVLYPEQDRLANAQGCWNWFDTRTGRAHAEAALILNAIDQVTLMHPVDRACVAVVGLSAGASMAALLATLHPARFQAVVMHSGIPPGSAHSAMSALGAMRGQVQRRNASPLRASSAKAIPTAPWPPMLVIHGVADAVVSVHNGKVAAQVWADAAAAQPRPERSVQRGKRHPMTLTDFTRGSTCVATLAEVQGLGHAWSGGAASQPHGDAQGPDASRMAWAFATKQFAAKKFAAKKPLAASKVAERR